MSLAQVISRTIGTTTFELSLNGSRPYQIRIYLASIGHRLAGDPPQLWRIFLYARYLKFRHPKHLPARRNDPNECECNTPDSFSRGTKEC